MIFSVRGARPPAENNRKAETSRNRTRKRGVAHMSDFEILIIVLTFAEIIVAVCALNKK